MGGIQKGFREKAVGRRIRLNSHGRQDVRKTDPFAEKRMRLLPALAVDGLSPPSHGEACLESQWTPPLFFTVFNDQL